MSSFSLIFSSPAGGGWSPRPTLPYGFFYSMYKHTPPASLPQPPGSRPLVPPTVGCELSSVDQARSLHAIMRPRHPRHNSK